MTETKVLISGAGVAGLALAHLLHRDGYRVTVVERAPAVRGGGYAIDFRGAAFEVLDELGILAEVRELDTAMRGTTLVDEAGVESGRLPAEAFAGELEVPKGDFTRVLHHITAAVDGIEYLFDDSVVGLSEQPGGVAVEFETAAAREFDLVFGADGVYSRVRRLAFEPDERVLHHLGLSGVGFTTDNFLGLDREGVLQLAGNAAVYLFSAGDPERITVSLSFATDSPALDRRGPEVQQAAVRAAFAGRGWHVPRLLDAMARAEDFFFASTCQVQLDRWASGRIALLGDAGYCAAPTAGMGTSQALLGARSLARNLSAADGDHRAAFAAYETELRPYVTENQSKGREAVALFGGRAEQG
ncbi:FAD-dependent monooxygenase [Streptomyces sp. NPDC057743]|uniref:FAD-dependent monooxygenase n=1 Tax=Streptomyces sp. NPDC057743 TaxID=3346236 RepID=UPI003686F684